MRCLIVDDSLAMRKMVIRALRDNGFDCDDFKEAGDGFEGLAALGSQPPDLVICDLVMPKLDGLKFAAAIRQKFPNAPTKVILLTAKASQLIEDNAARIGCNRVLAKPFAPDEFARKVRDCLEGKEP